MAELADSVYVEIHRLKFILYCMDLLLKEFGMLLKVILFIYKKREYLPLSISLLPEERPILFELNNGSLHLHYLQKHCYKLFFPIIFFVYIFVSHCQAKEEV